MVRGVMRAAVPGEEHSSTAGPPSRLDVGRLIADHVRRGHLDPQLVSGCEQQVGGGFPASTMLPGGVGAVLDRIEGDAPAREFGDEPLVDGTRLRLGDEAAADPGLVADDHQLEAGVTEAPQCSRGALPMRIRGASAGSAF